MALTALQILLLVGCSATVLAAGDSSDSSDDDASDYHRSKASLLAALGNRAVDDFGDDDLSDEDATPEVTAPCCFPKTWQGLVSSEFGFAGVGRRPPKVSRTVDQVYVDGVKQRVAGTKLAAHGGRRPPANVSYIVLVNADKTADLYLFNRASKRCRHSKLQGVVWRPQCLPANATLHGTFNIGPLTGGLRVQSWRFRVGGRRTPEEALQAVDDRTTPRPRPRPRMLLVANVLVVPGSCVPVVIQEDGIVGGPREGDDFDSEEDQLDDEHDWEGTMTTRRWTTRRPRPHPRPHVTAFVGGIYFSSVQTSIPDPSVFTPPSYCGKSDDDTLFFDDLEPDDDLTKILDRFLVL